MPHAQYSPSASHRWLKCPGCIELASTVKPPETGIAAIEGTVMHWIAERELGPPASTQDFAEQYKPGNFVLFDKVEADNGAIEYYPTAVSTIEPQDGPIVKLTEDMIGCVRFYLGYVNSRINGGDLYIEEKVEIADDIFGTADAVIDRAFDVLQVIDLKTGRNPVEAVDNPQLEIYGLGAMARFGDVYKRIDLTIVQPNADHDDGPIRTWSLTPDELGDKFDKFIEARERCVAEPGTYIDGPWCLWCGAIRVCPKMHERAIEVAKADFDDGDAAALAVLNRTEPAIVQVEIDKLKTILDAEKPIADLIKQAKKYAIDLLQSGVEIPGYVAEPSLGNRRWRADPDGDPDVDGLINYLKRTKHKLDEYKPRQLISPAKMEKLIAGSLKTKGKAQNLKEAKNRVAAFTTRPDNGLRLARVKTNKPALASAKADFEKVGETD